MPSLFQPLQSSPDYKHTIGAGLKHKVALGGPALEVLGRLKYHGSLSLANVFIV